jgi:7-cyano-7-deazaguanine synthase
MFTEYRRKEMKLSEAISSLPTTKQNVVAVLSGGLDSSVMLMLLIEKYGADKVYAVSYDYGQKQWMELKCARNLTSSLGVEHKIFDLDILGKIAKPMSANIKGSDVDMPSIKDVLGDPQPVTYVPFRNLILLSLTLACAEATNSSYVFTGLQVHDEYGYWDTTQRFVDGVNSIAEQNRTHKIKVVAPFSHLSKYQEIEICKELKMVNYLESTLTCYNPDTAGNSCGRCPSCAERIANFTKAGLKDPVSYSINIPWEKLIGG